MVSLQHILIIMNEIQSNVPFSAPALQCRSAIAITSASTSASTCKMLGQMSWNFSLSVFFLHFNFAYHTYKGPYNKSLRQAVTVAPLVINFDKKTAKFKLRFCHTSDGRHGFEKNISSCTHT